MNSHAARSLILAIPYLTAVVGGIFVQAQQIASVVVQLPGDLRSGTPFTVQLRNDLATSITFCTDFGQAVQMDSGRQAAPNPFEIQKWTGKRWDTQLIGTDVGSGDTTVSIDAHESKEFLLEISSSGRYRLKLTYYEGESDTKCPLPREHAITAQSKAFSVHAPVER